MTSEGIVSDMAVVDIVPVEYTTVSLAVEEDAVDSEHQGLITPDRDADEEIFAVTEEDEPDSECSTEPDSPSPIRPVPSWDPVPDVESSDVTKYSADLFRAALSGDWETVYSIAILTPAWLRTGITTRGDTVLHIAAAAKHLQVVEVVIKCDPSSLIYTNKYGSTPFWFAAVSGDVDIAKAMKLQNNELPYIRDSKGMTPLHMAILLGHRTMVWYLLSVTDDRRLTTQDRIEILTCSIENDLLDVALYILKNNTYLAFRRDPWGQTPLHALARKPLKQDGYQPCFWGIISNSCRSKGKESKEALELTKILWNQIIQQKNEDILASIDRPWGLLSVAAKLGKVEFLKVLIQAYPDLIRKADENQYSIFHIAVIHRQVEIFKMIHEIGAIKDFIATYKDKNNNNMLHLASTLAPINRLSSASLAAALQMQRELQWFEAVKQIVRPGYSEIENMNKKTPQDLFSEAHETLRKQGEEWMKKTSEPCALVAALIATMVFSAAFQLPGGLNNDTGRPVLVKNTAFVFFAMSNAMSLFTSTASILMFLSILTSRYSERDFLVSLPQKLMTGLILLLISIATMVVGFTVTFFITFQEGLRWPPITIAVLASVPITLFGRQQFPLLMEIYYSTYKFQSFFQPGQQKLFQVHSSEITWTKPDVSCYPLKERHVDYSLESYLPPDRRLTDYDIVA